MDKDTVSIIISALAVVVAATVGGAAFWRAGKSNSTAANGLQVAKDSRHLASQANSLAGASNKIAEDAADAARESATESKRSADVAVRVEARQTERDHVSWEAPGLNVLGHWTTQNVGVDTAHEAYASVCVDGIWHHSAPTDVEPQGCIKMDFTAERKAAAQAAEGMRASMASAGIAFFGSSAPRITYRITWRTDGGSWKTEAGKND